MTASRFFAPVQPTDALDKPRKVAKEIAYAQVGVQNGEVRIFDKDGNMSPFQPTFVMILAGVVKGTWYELNKRDALALCRRRPKRPDQPDGSDAAW